METIICILCNEPKPRSEYYNDNYRRKRKCIPCWREYQKQVYYNGKAIKEGITERQEPNLTPTIIDMSSVQKLENIAAQSGSIYDIYQMMTETYKLLNSQI